MDYCILGGGVLVMFAVSLTGRHGSTREWISKKPYVVKFALFTMLLFATVLLGNYGIGYDASAFIYNQF